MRVLERVKRAAMAATLAAFAMAGSTTIAGQKRMIQPAVLSGLERAELEAVIAEHVQMTLGSMKAAEGQLFPKNVNVKLDPEGGVLVELGRRFVLKSDGSLNGAYVPDQLSMIDAVVYTMVPEVELGGLRGGIKYRFDGHDITYYYPELRPRRKTTTIQSDAGNSPFPPYIPPPTAGDPSRMYIPAQPYPTANDNPPSVAVNPGHGLYKLYDVGVSAPNYHWTTQRDTANGVLEDEITPIFTAELEQWFTARSLDIDAFSTRSTSTQIHEQSTQESGSTHAWFDMGAKYHVEQLYPGRTDLWDVTSRTDNQRDRAKDINSRALFATEMRASAMISLHTNAAADATSALTARGTQVFYATGDADGLALASSIACYMEELIQAQPAYQTWTMRETAPSTQYAENSGSMPSALVEIAFHTNPDDARALQDPQFRTASMKGVEKGYRLWRDGRPCQPLSITQVSAASGSGKVPVATGFIGYPQFPVTMKVDIVKCPSGQFCTGGQQTQSSAIASPLTWYFGCNASSGSSTIRVKTTLQDADGVHSNSVESDVTCQSSGRTGVSTATIGTAASVQ